MIIATRSLNKYLEKSLSTEEIVDAFNKTEVEIEQIISSLEFDKRIVTGKVIRLNKHPNADKLSLAKVDIGNGNVLQIVCGASNIKENQIVPVATAGATLPDGFTIKEIKLRGEISQGMICSAKELRISDDHSGIMVLNSSTPIGRTLCDIIKSVDVLDIKTQPTRWDHLSIVGLSRDLSVYGPENTLIMPEVKKLAYNDSENVIVKEKGECKHFISARLKIENVVKSPKWLVDNLESNGVRSINPVVDITNFVMLETGQPAHAYDAKRINGKLAVRFASPSEKLTTIDSKRRQLTSQDLVIADEQNVVALAGVMGGSNTEVDNNTSEIILEVAHFDKTIVRKAAIRHGLRTEASARFERSLPLSLQYFAFERLIYLFEEICSAKVIDGPFDQLYGWPWIQHVGLRVRRAERILGVEIDERQIINGLKKLGFEAQHFSITKEIKKHLGKPYRWGANFKKDGTSAFDCSYLVDYVYSLIGIYVGHTALAQFEHGESVEVNQLRPGDVVFYEGLVKNSATDHYYIRDESGNHAKTKLKEHKKVGHNGMYIGSNKVIMAAQYEFKAGHWIKRKNQGVVEVPLSEFVNNPGYLGARRYIDGFNHIIQITAPWWRTDIKREEDIIEEVAKLIGYDNIPARLTSLAAKDTASHNLLPRIAKLKDLMVARGLFEVATYSFISEEAAKLGGDKPANLLEIENPANPQQRYLRRDLFASLVGAVSSNQHYKDDFGIFEISKVYYKQSKPTDLPDQPWVLAMAVQGDNSLRKIKGVLDGIEKVHRIKFKYRLSSSHDVFAKGRQADIFVDDKPIGYYGQLRPSLLKELGINSELSFAQIAVEDVLQNRAIKARAVPPYQYVVRDIALELNVQTNWQEVEEFVVKISRQIIKVEFISDYYGSKLAERKLKSLAFRVWLDLGANPTQDAIEKQLRTTIAALKKNNRLGVKTIR